MYTMHTANQYDRDVEINRPLCVASREIFRTSHIVNVKYVILLSRVGTAHREKQTKATESWNKEHEAQENAYHSTNTRVVWSLGTDA